MSLKPQSDKLINHNFPTPYYRTLERTTGAIPCRQTFAFALVLISALPLLAAVPTHTTQAAPASFRGDAGARENTSMPRFALHKVVERRPIAFQPYPENEPSYLLCYVQETLECGHQIDVNFIEGVEVLTAKYRRCPECDSGQALPRTVAKVISIKGTA